MTSHHVIEGTVIDTDEDEDDDGPRLRGLD